MKGQLFSMDLLISITIFFGVLILVLYFWFIVPTYPEYNLIEKANGIGDYLVLSKLGHEAMLLCPSISELAAKNYSDIKDELNVGSYDVWVTFSNTTNMCDGNKTTIGEQFTNTTYAASIIRVVNVKDEKMQMRVMIYE